MVHFNRKTFGKFMIKHYVPTLPGKCTVLIFYKHSSSLLFGRSPVLTQTELPILQGVMLRDCAPFVEAA